MSGESVSETPPAERIYAACTRRPVLALFLLCLALWLPGILSLPAMDRDEARFAQASKQMVETGNLVDIRFGTVPRYKKPIGIYWLQAASTAVFGHGALNAIWTYRVPSFLGGFAAVLLTFWLVRAIGPPSVAFAAALLLALCLLLAVESIIATTDAVLLATVVAGQGVLLRAYLAARDSARAPPGLALILIGWAAIGIGVLIKGPVTPVICLFTALLLSLWDRQWSWLRTLRPLRGLGVLLLIVLPWLIAIGIESHGAFFAQSLGHDFAGKLGTGQESHGAPPGYYLALSTITLWPATLFLIPALVSAVRNRRDPAIRFLLVWAGLVWIAAELVPTKLPHYVLPAFPALMALAALWFGAVKAPLSRAQRYLVGVAAVQFAVGMALIVAAPILAPRFYGHGPLPLWFVLAGLAGAVIGLVALLNACHRAFHPALTFTAAAAVLLYGVVTVGGAPRLDRLWVSEHAAALVAHNARPGDPPPILIGYQEPSLVFLLGTHTRLPASGDAAAAAARNGGLALVEERDRSGFLAHLSALGANAHALGQVSGLNYSRGKPVRITLYRVKPAP
ncbi:MAG: glycosyltransferase family 39 protein [Alphaproteobacteria bacterium]|nr:glycosyltransferase family 39 protein [Alphaproteobacteria bacterium]